MKITKKSAIIICISILLFTISACNSAKNSPVGQWYNSNGKCLDIRSDGSWKLEDSYGTGTWNFLDDKITIEFSDYYGDTQESKINSDELGNYIDFGHYGDFYKNSYPTIDKLNNIDAFENVLITTKGASPFCLVEVDTSNCPEILKKRFSYTVDKNYHAKGEKVTVYSSLQSNAKEASKLEKIFLLDDVAYYIDSLTESQKEKLANESKKYIDNQLETYKLTGEFCGSKEMKTYSAKVLDVRLEEMGLFRLKNDCFDKFGAWAYNSFYCIYAIDALNQNNNKEYTYVVEVLFPSIATTNDSNLVWYIDSQDEDNLNKIESQFYASVNDFSWYSTFSIYYNSEYYNQTIFETHDIDFK